MSQHNITVEGGTSVRLTTAGKYCDRDIIVTAEGGAENLDTELTEQENLLQDLREVLEGKAAGGCDHTIETWIFTLEDGTTVEKAVVVDA